MLAFENKSIFRNFALRWRCFRLLIVNPEICSSSALLNVNEQTSALCIRTHIAYTEWVKNLPNSSVSVKFKAEVTFFCIHLWDFCTLNPNLSSEFMWEVIFILHKIDFSQWHIPWKCHFFHSHSSVQFKKYSCHR